MNNISEDILTAENSSAVLEAVSEKSKILSYLITSLGIFGLIIVIAALPIINIVEKNILFIVGCALLGISSYLEKEYLFACLECILVINAALVLSHVSTMVNTIVLIVLMLLTIVFLCRNRKITFHLITGLSGLVFLSLGIIFISNFIMIFGGIAMGTYGYISGRAGFKVGWIFFAFNIIFVILAFLHI